MSKFWSPIVATLKPYVAGEQPRIQNLTKLNTNENPYGPSPKAIAAMQAAVTDSLKLYPDPGALALRQSIARFYGVEADEVFVVLAGSATLEFEEPPLPPVELAPGVVVRLSAGMRTVWTQGGMVFLAILAGLNGEDG